MPETLAAYGLSDRIAAQYSGLASAASLLGRVIRQDRGYAVVVTEDGSITAAVQAQRTGAVVAGDWVSVESETVVHVIERSSYLRRGVAARDDPSNVNEQPLVANVDVVFIVCGADRPRKAGRIERAIAQTWDANATPVLVLTKIDLLDDLDAELASLADELPMTEIVAVSSVAGDGIDELRERARDLTVTLLGESGAGKSTLLNALLGEDVGLTGEVREGDARGRHTTVRRELHLLPGGGVLVDTPGLRAIGLWTDSESVDATFGDFAELAVHCRFSDCAHETEPGCAVREAVEMGTVSAARFESWRALRKEAAALELRSDPAKRHKAERKFGRLVNEALELKGRKEDR